MNNRDKIVEHLRSKLEMRSDIYAFWIEGSTPQGYADEFSDIDLWLSTDDDKIFTIYDDIEQMLSEIAPIDFSYIVKNKGELGQNVYHLEGMSEFLTIDVNTQGISRHVYLVKDIDDAQILFDKENVVRFKEREPANIDIEAKRKKLQGFYEQMRPSLLKNVRRNKSLEALYYYHLILRYATKFLRLKYGWHEKTDFDLKHIYRDIPENEVKNLERFYDVRASDIEDILPELEGWIKSL
ncbi:MAG: nucleotidyltransferase domain-containing protein [Candidatus Saccharimonas sp.]|nr:nucleotidyltransferase domain-containing protein [Candidatus Saccharimonas sp.]